MKYFRSKDLIEIPQEKLAEAQSRMSKIEEIMDVYGLDGDDVAVLFAREEYGRLKIYLIYGPRCLSRNENQMSIIDQLEDIADGKI
jgi:hypothetical protein